MRILSLEKILFQSYKIQFSSELNVLGLNSLSELIKAIIIRNLC